ncbi:hypothetical protein ACJMK2_002129 [Sinanodonta woodiana]|uniref:Uncharacterized protein n=1 Tax=Sinanodonta woodiana TaxID=1069815 RepID=A0ABD3XW68_SINWO
MRNKSCLRLVIINLIVVGVHHYGNTQLAVGVASRLEVGPLNPPDQDEVAVFDGHKHSKYDAEVVNRKPGQICLVAFRCKSKFVDTVKDLLESFQTEALFI